MIIKNKNERESLREGGRILGQVLHEVAQSVKPGVTTKSLDMLAERLIVERGGTPSFKGYRTRDAKKPYPATLCVSINEEVVHGIPSDRALKACDVVGLDIGMKYKGFYTDTALTVIVEEKQSDNLTPSPPLLTKERGKEEKDSLYAIDGESRLVNSKPKENLVTATKEALDVGITEVRAGVAVGTIGNAIFEFLKRHGFSVVYELVGHGVGSAVHEDPEIPNWGEKGKGYILHDGEVIALEPMATLGKPKVKLLKDGWTWATCDNSIAAHFEHTLVVTSNGCEILTKA